MAALEQQDQSEQAPEREDEQQLADEQAGSRGSGRCSPARHRPWKFADIRELPPT
jgi:hypothetical protein